MPRCTRCAHNVADANNVEQYTHKQRLCKPAERAQGRTGSGLVLNIVFGIVLKGGSRADAFHRKRKFGTRPVVATRIPAPTRFGWALESEEVRALMIAQTSVLGKFVNRAGGSGPLYPQRRRQRMGLEPNVDVFT